MRELFGGWCIYGRLQQSMHEWNWKQWFQIMMLLLQSSKCKWRNFCSYWDYILSCSDQCKVTVISAKYAKWRKMLTLQGSNCNWEIFWLQWSLQLCTKCCNFTPSAATLHRLLQNMLIGSRCWLFKVQIATERLLGCSDHCNFAPIAATLHRLLQLNTNCCKIWW